MLGRRPTVRDVSEAAGVSTFTVSRALSGHAGVAEATRAEVVRIAAQLGYLPNRLARSLKRAESSTIGVLVSNNDNPYYASMVRGLEHAVRGRGFNCFVVDAVEDGVYRTERETFFVSSLLEQRVAGVVLTYLPTSENLALLETWGTPLVFVDCEPPGSGARHPSVTIDNRAASTAVGRHFATLGYRRWLFVGHTSTWASRTDREAGFRAAAADAGVRLEVVEGGNDRRTAETAVAAYLSSRAARERPDALYASNELLLHGSLRALAATGLAVPEDVAVVGFDEFVWSDMVRPAVTVVDQHIEEVGRTAGELLLDRLAPDRGRPVEHRVLPTNLVIRDSCGGRARRSP